MDRVYDGRSCRKERGVSSPLLVYLLLESVPKGMENSRLSRKTPVKSRGVEPEEKYRGDRAIIYLLTYAGLRVDELSNLL